MKIGISRIKVAHVFTVLFLLCLESGCSCAQDNKEKTTGTKAKKEFTLPDIPQVLTTSEDRAEYLVLHYWDNFDFTDTVLISKPEITEQAFVDFLNILPYTQIENSRKALIGLMESASSDNLMLTHFMELTEKYLYDPNSPMRNEELYIPVLEYIIASFNVKTEDKIRPEYRLQMALKNRPGDLATDFKFADGTGKVRKLSDVKNKYVLLYFNNPGCTGCRKVTAQVAASAFSRHSSLTVLAVYPDADLVEWKKAQHEIPNGWINSYNIAGEIMKKELYDLKAIPTLYLLDKDRKVILKDVTWEQIETYLSQSLK